MLNQFLERRWLRNVAVGLVIIAVFLSALPFMVRYLLVRNLDQTLAVESRIEQLKLNLFTGRLVLTDIHVQGQSNSSVSGADLAIDVAMLQLLRGNFYFESISAEDIYLRIEEDADGTLILVIPLTGADDAEPSEALELPLVTVNSLSIRDSRVEVAALGIQGAATVDRLDLENLSTSAEAQSSIELEMHWNDALFQVSGMVSPFAAVPTLALDINLEQLKIDDFEAFLPGQIDTLAGLVSFSAEVQGNLQDLNAALKLTVKDVAASSGHFAAALAEIDYQGTVGVTTPLTTPGVSLAGQLGLSNANLDDTRQGARLLHLDSLALNGFELSEAGELSLEQALITNMQTLTDPEAGASAAAVERLEIASLTMADNRVLIDSLTANAVTSSARVTSDGELHAQGVISGALESLEDAAIESEQLPVQDPVADPAGAEASGFEWRINRSVILDSAVGVRDDQYAPPLQLDILVDELVLGTMDSATPAQATSMNLSARIGEYGTVDVNGDIAPLAEQLAVNLDGTIESLRLPLLSPYIEHLLGYQLTAGQYDHRFKVSIAAEELVSENDMVLRKLTVKSAPDIEAAAPLPMPLGLALDMLRDDKDNINLSVPVSGRIDNPDIGVDQVISTALGKSLMAGSTTYLKLALQPYGAIWMGAGLGLKAAGRMSLDPMAFDPLSSQPNPENNDYANKLATLLTERPSLEMEICGKAGFDDYQALRVELAAGATPTDGKPEPTENADSPTPQLAAADEERLLQLARERQQILKQLLVQQHGIDPKRLYTCKAVAIEYSTLSGVELSL